MKRGCKTGKKSFRSELDAKIALARIAGRVARLADTRIPKRAYRCPFCNAWHLTSSDRN